VTDIATLGIEIDATKVDAAKESLDRLTEAGKRTEDSVKKTGEAGTEAGAKVEVLGNAASDVAKSLARGKDVTESLGEGLKSLTENLGETRTAFSTVYSIIGPTGLAIAAGILTAVAAFGAFNLAGMEYAERVKNMTAISEGMGRTAGITGDSLIAAARKAAQSGEITVQASMDQAQAYAQMGSIGTEILTGLIGVTDKYAEATGQTAAQATKELGAAFADPVKGAEELNGKLGFLNASQIENIQHLINMNDRLGAQRTLLGALGPALIQSSKDTESLASSWHNVYIWATNAWSAMGKAAAGYDGMAPKERLGALGREKAKIEANGNTGGTLGATISGWFTGEPAINEHYKGILRQIHDTTIEIQRAEDARKKAIRDTASAAGSAVATSLTPDSGALGHLQEQQKILRAGITSGAGDTPETLNRMRSAYNAVTDAIGRVTDASGNYISQEQRNHEIAQLTIQINGTKDKARKAELVTERELLKVGADAVTNENARMRAADAGALATSHAGRAKREHTDAVAAHLEKLRAEIDGQNQLNEAYDNGRFAELQATAAKAAATEIAGKKYSAIQAELEQERQLALAVAVYTGSVLKTAGADQSRAKIAQDVADSVGNGSLAYSAANKEIALQNTLLPMQQVLAGLTGAAHTKLAAAIALVTKSTKDLQAANGQLNIEGMTDKLNEETEALQLQLKMRGQNNLQLQIELDLLKARRTLADNNVAEDSPAGKAYIDATVNRDVAGENLKQHKEQDAFNTSEPLENMQRVQGTIQDMTRDFQTLFGTAGNGFAEMANAAADYATTKLDINDRLAQSERDNAGDEVRLAHDRRAASADMAAAQSKYYGNIITSAKDMFDKNSKGYKVLEAVEKAYRIYQLVSMAIHMATTAQAIALDTVHTGTSIANSTARSTAHGIEAIAHAFAAIPPPFNFIVAGLVGAALLAVGVKLFGGGGGGGASAAMADDTSQANKDVLSSSMKSPYSTLPGPGGLYNPSTVGQSPGQISSNDNYYGGAGGAQGAGSGGGMTIAPVYHINAPGADAGTVDRIQAVLDDHTAATVQLARQAAVNDIVSMSNRQRIGSAG
jgi:hypothetical protein